MAFLMAKSQNVPPAPQKYAALSSRSGNGKMASMSPLNFIEPVSQPPNGPQMEDRFTHSAPFTFSNSGDRQSLASKRCKQADSPLWLKRYGSSSFRRGGGGLLVSKGKPKANLQIPPQTGDLFLMVCCGGRPLEGSGCCFLTLFYPTWLRDVSSSFRLKCRAFRPPCPWLLLGLSVVLLTASTFFSGHILYVYWATRRSKTHGPVLWGYSGFRVGLGRA